MKKILAVAVILAVCVGVISKLNLGDALIHSVLVRFVTPSEKFWVHRCNSVEKARAMADKFAGIEIDANFYPSEIAGRKFDVSHNAQATVEYPLEEFMPVFAETNSKIWFDFKNLTDANAADSLAELENLLRRYNVDRARFVIESHNFPALKIYHDAGFYTSFYVTVDSSVFDDEESFRAEIHAAASSGNIDAISFPLEYYSLVKSSGVRLDFLTWNTHSERWWTFYRKSNLREIVDDSQVKVILVKMRTNFDRF